jgi:endoribonuclease Dicer
MMDQPQVPEKHELRVFPVSMCRTTTLPLDFWNTFAMVPTLNRLISTRTVARLAIDHLQVPQVDVEQLSKALTTPLSHVGFDYEYLETLGDSFLK